MTDKPTTHVAPVVVEQIPSVAGAISAIASANAPFIYFDAVPNFGFNSGVANLTLEAIRFTPGQDGKGVHADRIVVAHLRMSAAALQSLKSAVDGIELLAKPVPEGAKN